MASKDKFANMAAITVTESGTNTLTFKKLESGISLFEKVAWIIHRIEYLVPAVVFAMFNAGGDTLEFALTATDQIDALSMSNAGLIDYNYLCRIDLGAAASGVFEKVPFITDFTNLPMGGLIVPPNPLYLAAKGTSLTMASTVSARLYFTTYQLTADDYWELVEARRIVSNT